MSMRGLATGGIKLEKRPYFLAPSFRGSAPERTLEALPPFSQ